MKIWAHERDLKSYFDGTLEADLGLHAAGLEPSGTPDPTAQSVPPNGRAARESMNRIAAVLQRLTRKDFWTLAAFYTPIRPAERNGFRAPTSFKQSDSQLLDDNVLAPVDEPYSRVVLLTAKAQRQATTALGRQPETLAEVRDVVRRLRMSKKEPEKRRVKDIVGEGKDMLARAQSAYDEAAKAIAAEKLLEKRRRFLEGL